MNAKPAPDGSSLCLVSCVKTKRTVRSAAKDLYTSIWFVKARAYAVTMDCPWFILSAEHGLVRPDAEIDPYEKTLGTMRVSARRDWAGEGLADLEPHLTGVSKIVFLAGLRYREFLVKALEKRGYRVCIPMKGLPIGQQLAWLNRQIQPR